MSEPVVIHVNTAHFDAVSILRNARISRGHARVIFHVTGLMPGQTDAIYLKERPELMGEGVERFDVITGDCGCP